MLDIQEHPQVRTYKPLVFTVLGGIGYGVIYDVIHVQDVHIVPRVPAAIALSGSGQSISETAPYTVNWVTGDEIRLVPRYHRAEMEEDQTVSVSVVLSFRLTRRNA